MSKISKWVNAPISPTCEVIGKNGQSCGLPTDCAYPAAEKGWMALCLKHGGKPYTVDIEILISLGEKFE